MVNILKEQGVCLHLSCLFFDAAGAANTLHYAATTEDFCSNEKSWDCALKSSVRTLFPLPSLLLWGFLLPIQADFAYIKLEISISSAGCCLANKDGIAIYVGRIERKPQWARILFSLAAQFFMLGECEGESQSHGGKLQGIRTQLPSILQCGSSGSSLFHLRSLGIYSETQK